MKIYAYTISYDTGFAPCISNNEFTLACCKSNLRYKIGEEFSKNPKEDIYLFALCGKGLSKERKFGEEYFYSPLYMAKITDIVRINEYFSVLENGRRDQVYYCDENGEWRSLEDNPHRDQTDNFNPVDEVNKDILYMPRKTSQPKLNYVLKSTDYIYFGNNLIMRKELPKSVNKICEKLEKACRSNPMIIYTPEEEEEFIAWYKKLKRTKAQTHNTDSKGTYCRIYKK